MVRYEGENDKKIWMSEEEADSCTEWLFGYFPYRPMRQDQLELIKQANQAEDEIEEAEAEERAVKTLQLSGRGVIVGVGEIIEECIQIESEVAYENGADSLEEEAVQVDDNVAVQLPPASQEENGSRTTEDKVEMELVQTEPTSENTFYEGEDASTSSSSNHSHEFVTTEPANVAGEENRHEGPENDELLEELFLKELEPEGEEKLEEETAAAEKPTPKPEPIIEEGLPKQFTTPEDGEYSTPYNMPSMTSESSDVSEADTQSGGMSEAVTQSSDVVSEATTQSSDIISVAATEPDVNAEVQVGCWGRSQVARFFHTGEIMEGSTFLYGFAALTSSRFCTYWIAAHELDDEASL